MIYKQPSPEVFDTLILPLDLCQTFVEWAEANSSVVKCVRFKRDGDDMEVSYRLKGAGILPVG